MKLIIKLTGINLFYQNNFFSPMNSSLIIVCYLNQLLQNQLKTEY